MKKTRKIIPALAMLLVSAIMMSTASFAWFSMSTEVTASGMSVTAKSDAVALVISATNTTPGTGSTEETTAVSGTLLPVAHETFATKTDADTVDKWYTKYADAPTASTSSTSATTISDMSGYVVQKTVYISMATGSNDTTDLKVKSVTITAAAGTATVIDPVRVAIATAEGYVEYKSTGIVGADDVLAANVTDDAYIAVTIYVYYDGNDAAVFTNNSANLAGATVSVEFTVTAPTA